MKNKDLGTILAEHHNYLNGFSDGKPASFRGMDLSGYTFKDMNLTEADFTGANLRNARFENVTMMDTIMRKADLSFATFQDCTIDHSEITGTIQSVTFRRCDIANVHFRLKDRDELEFDRTMIHEVSFNH